MTNSKVKRCCDKITRSWWLSSDDSGSEGPDQLWISFEHEDYEKHFDMVINNHYTIIDVKNCVWCGKKLEVE